MSWPKIIVTAVECLLSIGRCYEAGSRLSEAIREKRIKDGNERVADMLYEEEYEEEKESKK